MAPVDLGLAWPAFLIARLLAKDPRQRLGSRRGAADVKAHPFFRGLNFALLRSSRPPVVPGASRSQPLHRSQSCSAATATAVRRRASKPPPPDARFDLF
ncbi:protein kinase PINOID-like [Miscanthus floridulus]|uniref:protein kinase PINOID-like n=1 Tax=Miscanthus floridulus TaxID=154761 RepID=UPI00345AE800